MNRKHVYVLLVVACVAVVVLADVLAPEPVDWTPSYVHADERPFGSRILYEQLPALFGEEAVRRVDVPIYRSLEEGRPRPQSYVFVTTTFAPHPVETRRLLDYVAGGGHVFVAASAYGDSLANTLRVETSPRNALADSIILNFVNPALRTAEGYQYRADVGRYVFVRFDTSRTTILGAYGDGRPTFVRTVFGNGAFYLSSTPRAFTNYAMLHGDGDGYVYRALSYLPEGTVWWDDYYKPVRTQAATPLRYVLAEPALRWAYFVGLATLLLFVVVQARRRQRPIPVEEPPENATRAFAETVGRLYYRHGDHADLARKKIAYFRDYLRQYLNVHPRGAETDDALAEDVTERSGVARKEVVAVFDAIRQVEGREQLTEKDLLRLTRRIDAFYERSMR